MEPEGCRSTVGVWQTALEQGSALPARNGRNGCWAPWAVCPNSPATKLFPMLGYKPPSYWCKPPSHWYKQPSYWTQEPRGFRSVLRPTVRRAGAVSLALRCRTAIRRREGQATPRTATPLLRWLQPTLRQHTCGTVALHANGLLLLADAAEAAGLLLKGRFASGLPLLSAAPLEGGGGDADGTTLEVCCHPVGLLSRHPGYLPAGRGNKASQVGRVHVVQVPRQSRHPQLSTPRRGKRACVLAGDPSRAEHW